MDASELDRIFRDSKNCDSSLFAEMRSNLLLVSGDHYQKKGSRFWDRIKDDKTLTESQKLRLTKNHIEKITDGIKGAILSHAPSTTVMPVNQSEIQDQKAAELNNAVLSHYKKTLGIRSKIRDFGGSFVNLGEVCAKVFWDNDLGPVKSISPVMDEEGNVVMGIEGPEQEVTMEGAPVIEPVYGFNLLRDPEVQCMEDSPYLIVVKLVHQNVVKRMTKDPEIVSAIDKTSNDEFLVFDTSRNTYSKEKEHVVIREHYYRPCKEYPKGYYYIAVENVILIKGELPNGIWPLVYKTFKKIETSPRGRSPIKQMRPYQIEINRCASSIATAQVTLGDPKLILRNGGKMTEAGSLPGVRAVKVSGGQDPIIMQGASGENYVPYMNGQIDELYKLMNQYESDAFKDGTMDPYTLLYYSMRNKNKFLGPGEAFEEFVVEVTEKLLEVVKHYISEDMLIPIIGKNEMVNVAEFKNTVPNKYKIQVEAVSGDTDTMLGKQLAINHTLQFVGNSLGKQDIGRLLRAMPFMNFEEAYGDLTINYDNAKNDILAIERGETPQAHMAEDHEYILQRIAHRTKQADFKFLPENIQQTFFQYQQIHEQMLSEKIAALQRAQSGFIPTDGYMVKCDFYVTQPDGKTARASLPFKAIEWLISQLEAQGSTLESLEILSERQLAQMNNNREGNPATGEVVNGQ